MRDRLPCIRSSFHQQFTWTMAIATLWAAASIARADFLLTDSDRVVFYGGRSMQSGPGLPIEKYVRVRYPHLNAEFWHQQVRPEGTVAEANQQFADRVAVWKPTIVVLCFGLGDAGREPFDPARLDAFVAGMRELAGRCTGVGAKVWLLTPPQPDVTKQARLQEIQFGDSVARYAEAIRTLGTDLGVPVLDWFAAMSARRSTTAGKAALDLNNPSGVDPSPLGVGVATDEILSAWKAEPWRVVIRADWTSDTAEASVGAISVSKPNPETLLLSLKGVPLPWTADNRGGIMAEDWPPSRFYEYMLQIDNVPEAGFIVSEKSEGGRRGEKPFLSQMLRDGADVSYIGPFAISRTLGDLEQAIRRKNTFVERYVQFKEQKVPEPEYEQAYQTYNLAHQQLAEAAAKIIRRVPRTMDIEVEIMTMQAAQQAAREREAQAPTTAPAATQLAPASRPWRPAANP